MLHKNRTNHDKTRRELEAESVSYIVCKYIGLETGRKHSDYIALPMEVIKRCYSDR